MTVAGECAMIDASYPTFSKYEILSVLGHGSMGTVYQAQHTVLGRIVALKVPRPEVVRSSLATERFLREGRALAMLQHPHVVSIYDADQEEGLPYIAMEYVEGGTLSDRIQESRRLPLSKIQSWGIQIAQALEYIHNKGILHRDLKSANILVSSDDQARITDFGIAHVEMHATITNGMLGTPAYMSPEQARGESLDRHSDIYSLGVILFEALTGQIPFLEENGLALIQRIIHEAPPLIHTLRPDAPSWLAHIIYRCLQKDPEQRYQNSAQVVQALQEKKEYKTSAFPFETSRMHATSRDQFKAVQAFLGAMTARMLSFMSRIGQKVHRQINHPLSNVKVSGIMQRGLGLKGMHLSKIVALLRPPYAYIFAGLVAVVILWGILGAIDTNRRVSPTSSTQEAHPDSSALQGSETDTTRTSQKKASLATLAQSVTWTSHTIPRTKARLNSSQFALYTMLL